MTTRRDLRIAIIGAGPGGLCMAIKLKEAGVRDFVLLEKTLQVGGTWNHNRYPGCACDIQSELYSFSFDINTSWSRPYAPQRNNGWLDSVAVCVGGESPLGPFFLGAGRGTGGSVNAYLVVGVP